MTNAPIDELSQYRLDVATSYVEDIRDTLKSTQLLKDEIDMLKAKLQPGGVDYSRDIVDTMPYGTAIEDGIIKLQDMIIEYLTCEIESIERYRELHRVLLGLEYPYRDALSYHYLLLMPWGDVAKRMCYSVDYIYEIRRTGLIALYDHIPHYHRDPVHSAI